MDEITLGGYLNFFFIPYCPLWFFECGTRWLLFGILYPCLGGWYSELLSCFCTLQLRSFPLPLDLLPIPSFCCCVAMSLSYEGPMAAYCYLILL